MKKKPSPLNADRLGQEAVGDQRTGNTNNPIIRQSKAKIKRLANSRGPWSTPDWQSTLEFSQIELAYWQAVCEYCKLGLAMGVKHD